MEISSMEHFFGFFKKKAVVKFNKEMGSYVVQDREQGIVYAGTKDSCFEFLKNRT